MWLRSLSIATVLGLGLSGCPPQDQSQQHAHAGHGHAGHTGGPGTVCSRPGDTYVLGLKKQGQNFQVSLVDALPAPPARYQNAWTIEVTDNAGAPVQGGTVAVTPFMPAHGHGTNKKAVITDMGGGRYRLDPVWLFMPGLWEVTLSITAQSGMSDAVKYAFCIEG